MVVENSQEPEGRARRRGGAIFIAAIALLGAWAAGGFSGRSETPDVETLMTSSVHREARAEILAAIELQERFGRTDELAEVMGLAPAGNFDEFRAACGYRMRDGAVERVVVLGPAIIGEDMAGAGAVFRHIEGRVGCPLRDR